MKKTIAIFGGGPSSLALASFLDSDRFDITIYEQNKTCGRKFLVAGKGGFNLTYAEPLEDFKKRYIPATFLDDSLDHFTNADLRSWLSNLGIETFVGSSKRVFPLKGIKPIQLLDAILKHLVSKGVRIKNGMKWQGWSPDGNPIVNEDLEVKADYCVYAFGGGSWKVTGSTGEWASQFRTRGIGINDFEPSNCAFEVKWPIELLEWVEGKPLKNISVTCDDKTQKGELVITRFGLEGNGIYALSSNIRKQLHARNRAMISIDFKPVFSIDEIKYKLHNSKSRNSTEFLRKEMKLSKVQIQMIKHLTTKEDFMDSERLAELIKKMPIAIEGLASIDEAISTVGGIKIQELTEHFELRKMRNSYCIGEMVDWDAPTGGYLLQGCISMGVFLANYMNRG